MEAGARGRAKHMNRTIRAAIRLVFLLACVFALSFCARAAFMPYSAQVISEAGLNFRARPSADGEVLDQLAPGSALIATGPAEDGWIPAAYCGRFGYVSADYIAPCESAATDGFTALVSEPAVNVREAADAASALAAKLTQGMQVIPVRLDGTWYFVRFDGGEGYIRSDLLTLEAAQAAPPSPLLPENEPAGAAALRSAICSYARTLIGTPYAYAGKSPETGFDCSGFTYYVMRHFGISLSGNSGAQYENDCLKIGKDALLPGDLVFFNCGTQYISHVGIYLGDGDFIHSPSPGKSVCISSLDEPYYSKYYYGAGRCLSKSAYADYTREIEQVKMLLPGLAELFWQ